MYKPVWDMLQRVRVQFYCDGEEETFEGVVVGCKWGNDGVWIYDVREDNGNTSTDIDEANLARVK